MLLINQKIPTLAPLPCELAQLELGAISYQKLLSDRLGQIHGSWQMDFFPTAELVEKISRRDNYEVRRHDGTLVGFSAADRQQPAEIVGFEGIKITYPWDLLDLLSIFPGKLEADAVCGKVSASAHADGFLVLGENSVILPGVYIEGNAVIGRNCRIGPNAYIRGNTLIGDNCRIGQAVEIKNSIINSGTHIGHLSYVGDSIIGRNVNFGAGTIAGNLRHDNLQHHSEIDGKLIATNRRKLGVITGENVHTGIHTSIYPGRKLFSGATTLPGEVIRKDRH